MSVRRAVFIASDHAGLSLKKEIVDRLRSLSAEELDVHDMGPQSDVRVDYPDFADLVSARVLKTPGSFGILVCGSGQGMAMRANKFSGIRAALAWDTISAKLAREHNDANILSIGGRLIPSGLAHEIVDTFMNTPFEGGRHAVRVEKISKPPVS